jgi:hypothetical protein
MKKAFSQLLMGMAGMRSKAAPGGWRTGNAVAGAHFEVKFVPPTG